jgi:1,4-alpha-glucan branching enzyme
MQRVQGGWFSITIPNAGPGTRYKFRIDNDIEVPDPASHFQPGDVHGPSEVIDHRHDWKAGNWKGRPWHECIFLELHVGTFTPQGTFRGAIDKLDHIAAAGITAVELMPVADFSGRWNWGYDGVLLYAPDSAYGRPEELRLLSMQRTSAV